MDNLLGRLQLSPKIESLYCMLLMISACSRTDIEPPDFADIVVKVADIIGCGGEAEYSELLNKVERAAGALMQLCELPRNKWPYAFVRWQDAVIAEDARAAAFWLMQLNTLPPRGRVIGSLFDD